MRQHVDHVLVAYATTCHVATYTPVRAPRLYIYHPVYDVHHTHVNRLDGGDDKVDSRARVAQLCFKPRPLLISKGVAWTRVRCERDVNEV